MPIVLFPFTTYWWFYLAFTVLIVLLLGLDLYVHRHAHVLSLRRSLMWTCFWMALAFAFSCLLYFFAASQVPVHAARRLWLEFLTGYVVEQSLSVDNMFVFALLFRYFHVESRYQRRVLFYGVLGAIIFRGLFIAAGSALMRFEWVAIAFGVFLIVTGLRMVVEAEKTVDPGGNPAIRLVRRWLPVSKELHGDRFVVRSGGILQATPLLIVLLALETTDILFAVDSVPAVFAVTSEPLVVFTSNVFAILGLRAMYFLLAGALDRFHALKYGLAFVLCFVGVKMAVLDHLGSERFPAGVSLLIICTALAVSIVVSLVRPAAAGRPWVRSAVGSVCLALAGLSAAGACGLLEQALPGMERSALSISAGCYGVIAWVLLRFGRGG